MYKTIKKLECPLICKGEGIADSIRGKYNDDVWYVHLDQGNPILEGLYTERIYASPISSGACYVMSLTDSLEKTNTVPR